MSVIRPGGMHSGETTLGPALLKSSLVETSDKFFLFYMELKTFWVTICWGSSGSYKLFLKLADALLVLLSLFNTSLYLHHIFLNDPCSDSTTISMKMTFLRKYSGAWLKNTVFDVRIPLTESDRSFNLIIVLYIHIYVDFVHIK